MVNNTKIQLEQSELIVDGMTLLLGARCVDGVVLAADTKFAGKRLNYGKKITGELDGILTGFSGDYGSFILFTAGLRNYVNGLMKSQVKDMFQTPYQALQLGANVDGIIWEINRIKSELKHKFYVLMAVSGAHFAGKSQLYQFYYVDGCIPINDGYEVLGSGEPYCSYLMQKYFRYDMTIKEFAQLADFAIRFVGDPEYDFTQGDVGLNPKHQYPQIIYIPDDPNFCKPYNSGKPKLDCKPSLKELKQFKTNSEKQLKSLYNLALKF